VPLVVNEL